MKVSAKWLLASAGFACGAAGGVLCLYALRPSPVHAPPTAGGPLPAMETMSAAIIEPDVAGVSGVVADRPPG